ncbi:family 16 glycoside hydrolase [Sedimentibacter sp. MB31-C6]|uniref:family 16 glycoside hydrolase n=1 Tax=Sedimentibacter sp. MB31-C6 TaxID=3109366 RepID=UPI002DDD3A0B|nr:family 16 glycoside hydrolase [Sedimentibacter sp. MB36-C1]WSI05123.1 family 16 glycoside hydrolase [Sedimentibacter sp. MB36-C1]
MKFSNKTFTKIVSLVLLIFTILSNVNLPILNNLSLIKEAQAFEEWDEEDFPSDNSPFSYRMVVAYFGYWYDEETGEYWAEYNGEQQSIGSRPNSKLIKEYTFPVALISGPWKVVDIMNYNEYDGDWDDLNYSALKKKQVDDHYMSSANIFNEEIIIGRTGDDSGDLEFEANFYPLDPDNMGFTSPDGKYSEWRRENVWRCYVAVVIKYIDETYEENPEEWMIEHGLIDPPEPEVHANLEMDIPDLVTWNYKQYDENMRAYVEVGLDASDSTSNLSVDSYDFEVDIGTRNADSKSGTSDTYYKAINVYPDDVNAMSGDIVVKGSVTVTDETGLSDTATDVGMVDVEIVNEPPNAYFDRSSNNYVSLPVTLSNGSSDPEDDLEYVSWTIKDSKGNLIFYSDTNLETGEMEQDYTPEYFESVNFDEDGGKLIFTESDNYEVEIYVRDDGGGYGKEDDTYRRTVYVNTEPQPPVADFSVYEFGYPNESIPIKDMSTDPNDDIVQWTWTKPTINKDDGMPASLSGNLNGKNGGSLTFREEGTYDISLKVRDYTGLEDSITKEVKVIPPIAVARITEEGTLKENRHVKLHMRDSLSPRTDPIQTARNIWEITPLDGQSVSSIKIDPDTSNNEEKNILFKETGRYEVYLKVHNNFGDANPTHPNSPASEITKIIEILPDENPISDFTVGGATPNFYDNPVSTTVEIEQSAYSIDEDIIDKYKYVVYRDMDEDGSFDDESVYGTYDVGNTDILVNFEQSVSGKFKVDLEVTEEFGQPTIDKFVTAADRRKALSSKEFTVNWIPDITFDIPEWAYTDDVLSLTTKLKDEEIGTLKVDWSIKRASEDDTSVLVDDDIDTRAEYSLNNNGGAIRFKDSGYYELIGTVTDEVGQSYSFGDEIRIYPLPTAVIKDNMTFGETPFTTKENRKYQLDGNSSFGNDYYGAELHEIDHSKDYWEITTLDGQNSNVIKVASGTGELKNDIVSSTTYLQLNDALEEDLLFKEKGRYKIRYQVTNVHGKKSPFSEEIITVDEDTKPIIDFDIVETTYRDVDDSKRAELVIYNLQSSSDDGDILINDLHRVRYRFDSDNDGSYIDETWKSPLDIDFTNNRATVKVSHVGDYQFEFYVKDTFGQDTINQFVTTSDRRSNTITKVIKVDNMPPTVDFTVTPSNKVDVVFTVGQADSSKTLELDTKINNYVKMYLEANNADFLDTRIETIETSTISSNDADAAAVFNNWERYGTEPDTWSFSSSTGIIKRDDNSYWSGFYDPSFNSSSYTFEVELGTNGSDNDDIGVSFGIDGTPTGHLAFLISQHGLLSAGSNTNTNKHGHPSGLYQYNGATIKGLYSPTSSVSFTRKKWHKMKAIVKDKNIKIWWDDVQVVDYTHSSDIKGSFGFFTNSQPEGRFKNLTVTSGSVKTLDEVLKEPTWRDDATKFVINISDIKLSELETASVKYPVVLSRMLNDELYFAELGTSINRSQILNFIAGNDGKGTFIYNTNMDTALQNLAEWILNTVRSQAKSKTQYILLNEEINYKVFYEDYEEDPQMNVENWRYEHDYRCFQNDLGKVAYDGLWLSESKNSFDKVGRFVTDYKTKDNPVGSDDNFEEYRKDSEMKNGPLNIYVHRKPIAQFTMDMTKSASTFSLTLTDTSYDLDHTNRADKGLVAREWSWKKVGESTWHSGKLTSGNNTEEYLVKLRVRDMDGENGLGVWSDDTVILITSQAMPPISQFVLSSNVIAQGATLGITDTSYDPNGDTINQWEWKLYKEGTLLGTYTAANSQTAINNKIKTSGIGDFSITLQVSDSSGPWGDPLATSEIYTQTFRVVPINHAPVANFNLVSNESPAWTFPKNVTLSSSSYKTFKNRPSATSLFFEELARYNVSVSDPNGADNLGFTYEWSLENYKVPKVSGIGGTPSSVKVYSTATPFTNSFKNAGLSWGAYKITLKVTDMPKIPPYEPNSALSTYVTKTYYVVPDISVVGNFSSSNPEIIVGDTISLTATTNKEVTGVTANLSSATVNMTKVNTVGETTYWEGSMVIPETITDTGTYDLQYVARTNYGSETGVTTKEMTNTIPIDIVALRLLNFRITDIVNHDTVTFPYTKDMLVDDLIDYKTGYYVTFRIDSKGNPDNVDADIFENSTLKQQIDLVKVSSSGSSETWEGKFFTSARLPEGTEISIRVDCNKGATIYDYNAKEGWDGKSLRVSGSALQDGRVNLIR